MIILDSKCRRAVSKKQENGRIDLFYLNQSKIIKIRKLSLSMNLTSIHKLSIKNYQEIIDLWDKSALPYKPQGRDSYEFLKNRLESSPTWILGKFDDRQSKLIGIVIASHDGQRGWINRLAIDPDFRKLGYAKQLILAAEDLLQENGILLWTTLIEQENVYSQLLFQKLNYVKHEDIIYFSKRLSSNY